MDAWFSGFADGEACFMLVRKRQGRPATGYHIVGVQPWLQIGLRLDDRPVLEMLQATFGGTLKEHAVPDTPGQGNRRPRAEWMVMDKASLLGLVDYFDRFPLRSKKARDYTVWRAAVVLYAAHGARHPDLPMLRACLMEGRAYTLDAA